MNTIIIGFSRDISTINIGSNIIQHFEKSDYSHVYIRYTDPITNFEIVSQASNGFVNEIRYDFFIKLNHIVKEYILEVTERDFNKILFFIKENLGKPYSYIQLFVIAIKRLFNVELDIKNQDEAFICSELASKVCNIIGINNNISDDLETPKDIDILLQQNNIKRLI